jgi:hypothetical protein
VPHPDLGGQRDDIFEVAAHGRLAAGKVQLQDAELGGRRQHVEPHARRQLVGDDDEDDDHDDHVDALRRSCWLGWTAGGTAPGST